LTRESLRVEQAELLPLSAWEAYYAPMLRLIEEVRRYRAEDPEAQAWAVRNEAILRAEQAVLPYVAYAHLLARRID